MRPDAYALWWRLLWWRLFRRQVFVIRERMLQNRAATAFTRHVADTFLSIGTRSPLPVSAGVH